MLNRSRLDLVHKAIGAGIFGNIEWKPESYARVRADAEMQGYTPEAVRLLLRQHVLAGNLLSIRQETREERCAEDPDNPYWYRAIIPVSEFPKGLFVEVVLIDYDESEPFVMIVNAHPQLS